MSITRYSDLAGTQLVASTDFVFDELGRLTDLTHAQGATILADYGWTFDAAGRLVQQTSPDGTVDYDYDSTGQLTGADYVGDWQSDEDYQYDDNGNRVTANGDSYTTGDYNRLTFDGTYTYEYGTEGNRTARFIDVDASGTLTTGDTDVTEYTWDVVNRLAAVTNRDTAGGAATQVVEYLYDLYNRRISKQIDDDGNGAVDYAESYVYDGTDIVLDFVDADGAGPANPQLAKRYLWGPAVDQLLAQEDATGTGTPADIVWPLTDHLGTVRDLVDSTAAPLTHYQYDTYGNITLGDTTLIRYLFTSQEYDLESGLYYYDARYYDPTTGKLISEDIIGFNAGDANFYRYVGNGVTGATDPDGLYERRRDVFFRGSRIYYDPYLGAPRLEDYTLLMMLSGDPAQFRAAMEGDFPKFPFFPSRSGVTLVPMGYRLSKGDWDRANAWYHEQLLQYYRSVLTEMIKVGDALHSGGMEHVEKLSGYSTSGHHCVSSSSARSVIVRFFGSTSSEGPVDTFLVPARIARAAANSGKDVEQLPFGARRFFPTDDWPQLREALVHTRDRSKSIGKYYWTTDVHLGVWSHNVPFFPGICVEKARFVDPNLEPALSILIHESLHDYASYSWDDPYPAEPGDHYQIREIVADTAFNSTNIWGPSFTRFFEFLKEAGYNGETLLDQVLRNAGPRPSLGSILSNGW